MPDLTLIFTIGEEQMKLKEKQIIDMSIDLFAKYGVKVFFIKWECNNYKDKNAAPKKKEIGKNLRPR